MLLTDSQDLSKVGAPAERHHDTAQDGVSHILVVADFKCRFSCALDKLKTFIYGVPPKLDEHRKNDQHLADDRRVVALLGQIQGEAAKLIASLVVIQRRSETEAVEYEPKCR